MTGNPIDVVVFAPLAPVFCVLLFWFIQLLFIESQKFLLSKIWHRHQPFCRFTNFLGILYQTICHAMGYTITRSGISNFYVSVDYGKVSPKKEKKGIFEWLSNGFLFWGPFFIPAFLLLFCLFFLANGIYDVSIPSKFVELKYTFGGQIITFGNSIYVFSAGLLSFLVNIDLLNPIHVGFLFLLIFLGLGIRPSYIAEKTKRKVDMFYDIGNIKNHIIHKPLYILAVFLAAYIYFYISVLLDQDWYVMFFSILGWLSVASIIAIIIADLLIVTIKVTDAIPKYWRSLPYLTMIMSYVLLRVLFFVFQKDFYVEFYLSISLLVSIASAVVVTFILLKYKTNIFKSKSNMKKLKKVEYE